MLSVKGYDFAHMKRRKWVRCYGRNCVTSRRAERLGGLLLFAMGCGFALLVTWAADAIGCEPDGFSLHAGIGVHAMGLSAPDYTTPNPIGLIEARYTRGRFEWALSHRSSLQGFPAVFDSPGEDGYGVNMIEMRVRLW